VMTADMTLYMRMREELISSSVTCVTLPENARNSREKQPKGNPMTQHIALPGMRDRRPSALERISAILLESHPGPVDHNGRPLPVPDQLDEVAAGEAGSLDLVDDTSTLMRPNLMQGSGGSTGAASVHGQGATPTTPLARIRDQLSNPHDDFYPAA
jgi:hypothetical protein